jgi:hypothetical protein
MGCGGSKPSADDVAVASASPGSPAKPAKPSSATRALAASAAGGASAISTCAQAAHPSASLSDGEAAAWLDAIQSCVDAVWGPLVAELERRIEAGEATSSWDELSTADVLRLVRNIVGEGGRPAVRDATEALLALAAPLWERQRRLSGEVAPGSANAEARFASAPLCKLVGSVGIALCRVVGVEDAAGFARRVAPWHTLCAEYGLAGSVAPCEGEPPDLTRLSALLDAQAKALLVFSAAVGQGDAMLKLKVERPSALWDAAPQWLASAFAEKQAASKLFPKFRSAQDGGWEAGEGHGPRKELFALAGSQMLRGGGEADGGGAAPSRAPCAQMWFFFGWPHLKQR